MKSAAQILQFLPLTVFVLVARSMDFSPEAWNSAFRISGAVALLQMILFRVCSLPLNALLMGVNLYLVTGGAAFAVGFQPILRVYDGFREAALFGMIFIAGAVATLGSRGGFVDVEGASAESVRRYSLLLLFIAGVAFVTSWMFRGNVLLAGTLPFLVLILSRNRLRARAATGTSPAR